MKKRYVLAEFLAVLFLLLIPPVFADKGVDFSDGFSFSVLAEFFIAAALQFQFKFENKCEKKSANEKFIFLIKSLKWSTLTIGFLMLILVAVHAVSFVFKISYSEEVFFPNGNISAWIFLIFALAAGAFFEEVLYRQFVPETLHFLLKKWKPLVEIFSVLIFAFAHRYLGWISVCNAVLCGAVLRICRIKTDSIVPSAVSHFLYNLLLIIFCVCCKSL